MFTEFESKADPESYKTRILNYSEAIAKIKEHKEKGQKVVLAQGVFDIVHVGHLEYLRKSKANGDILFVGIENDTGVRLNKGDKRPFNNLRNRLEFLSQLKVVDYVFAFDDAPLYSDPNSRISFIKRYKDLVPDIITATTSWDSSIELKGIQANEAGIELKPINIELATDISTTRLLQAIGFE